MKQFSDCDKQNSDSFCRLDKSGLINDTKRIAISKNRITAGCRHSVGLKPNGTVMAVGDNKYGQCDVSDWRNIVAVATGNVHMATNTGNAHTVGLKSD